MYEIMKKFDPKDTGMVSGGSSSVQSSQGSKGLIWDKAHGGQGLSVENEGKLVMLKEPAYVFRTCIGTGGFTSGQHYWEIIPDSRTENELKIGITTTLSFDFNTAFCDHVFGFSYYGMFALTQDLDSCDTVRMLQAHSTANA